MRRQQTSWMLLTTVHVWRIRDTAGSIRKRLQHSRGFRVIVTPFIRRYFSSPLPRSDHRTFTGLFCLEYTQCIALIMLLLRLIERFDYSSTQVPCYGLASTLWDSTCMSSRSTGNRLRMLNTFWNMEPYESYTVTWDRREYSASTDALLTILRSGLSAQSFRSLIEQGSD